MKVKIKDISEVINGSTPSTDNPDYYNGDIVWITPKDLSDQDSKYIETGAQFITKKGFNSCSTKMISKNNILMSSRAPIGLISINKNDCCTNQGFKSLIVNKTICDTEYLYYYLKLHIKEIESLGGGTTFKEISKSSFENFIVDVPSIEQQIKLSNCLKKIDDKIITNNKINDNLQQLCESIFLQSFANRKPNGIIGDILLESPKSKIQVGQTEGIKGRYPFFTSGASIVEWNESFIEGINLFLSTGGNASINIFNGKAAYSTDTWCIKGKNNTSIYLYLFIKNVINKINDWHFTGSGLKHLQKDTFAQISLYIPNEYEINHFNLVAVNCYKMISDNYLENKRLESIRDFLLPLLMNGQATIE